MKMAKGKINIMGSIRELKVGESFTMPRSEYKLSSTRTIASVLTADTGFHYSVARIEGIITVARVG
jgi:hypothetical protein